MTESKPSSGSLPEKADAAFERVATKVVERAKRTHTPVVVWEDGQVTELSPEQINDNRTPKPEHHA